MDVVAQAAAGLQSAHAMGLIHRDISRGTLLPQRNGEDHRLGISDAVGSVPGPVTGCVAGTAEYLAPELDSRGSGGEPTYALGVVAYQCLAGAPPFMGEPPDVACAHRDHPVPPLPGSVPAEVSALVMRLVAKDPAGRPGSAAEVAEQAGRLRHGLRDDFAQEQAVGLVPWPPRQRFRR